MEIQKGAHYQYKDKLVIVLGKCITDTEKTGILYQEVSLNTNPIRMTREELFIQDAKEVKSLTWILK